jgi:hypothetical protein
MVSAMVGMRPRRVVRAAVMALALVVLVAQVAWARGAVCVAALGAHAACKCCEERARAVAPIIAADCCAVEDAPSTAAARGAVAVAPVSASVVAALPPAVAVEHPERVSVRRRAVEVEARCAGPPLWLRLRSLRL